MALRVRRQWLDAILLLVFLAALASWGFDRYQASQTVAEASRIAAVLQLGSTSRVADIGAGGGRFTVELARGMSPDGYVYATEIDLDNLRAIQEAVADARLANVTTLQANATDTGLPPGCCDAVFLRTVYHHLTQPEPIVADLFAAVRPGGRLAIIDFPPRRWLSLVSRVDGVPDDRGGHGVPSEVVVQELTAAGFALDRQIGDWGRNTYCLVFTRPDSR